MGRQASVVPVCGRRAVPAKAIFRDRKVLRVVDPRVLIKLSALACPPGVEKDQTGSNGLRRAIATPIYLPDIVPVIVVYSC